MKVFKSLKDIPADARPLHLALGVFDGVHIGHQEVIQAAVSAAKSDGGVAGVLTFDPHPIQILAPEVAPKRILASLDHKKELLADLGVEMMIVISFTEAFAAQEADQFLNELHRCLPQLKSLSIGRDWKFGKKRKGDLAMLEVFGAEHGIQISAIPAVMIDGERVSSTRIRQAIRDGDMKSAASMLGRDYTVLGTVIQGRQLGRTLGFPTANLRAHNEQLPCDGVWAVEVSLENGALYRGVGNLGLRPTLEEDAPKRMLEIYLIGFDGDLYGEDVEVRFLKHLRGERKFASLDALKDQIEKDVTLCENLGIS